MTWEEDEGTVTHQHRLMQMQFAEECIETKTVTTTTTTKRSYPPLIVREPRNLSLLDPKEYPLAGRPTPPELRKLTIDLGDGEVDGWNPDEDMEMPVRYSCPCRHAVHSLTLPRSSLPRLAVPKVVTMLVMSSPNPVPSPFPNPRDSPRPNNLYYEGLDDRVPWETRPHIPPNQDHREGQQDKPAPLRLPTNFAAWQRKARVLGGKQRERAVSPPDTWPLPILRSF